MPNLNYVWDDAQIEEVNGRALSIFATLDETNDIPAYLAPVVYQGILNMCGQIEMSQVTPGAILPRMDIPRGG